MEISLTDESRFEAMCFDELTSTFGKQKDEGLSNTKA